jgi:hypothetical protein
LVSTQNAISIYFATGIIRVRIANKNEMGTFRIL